MQQITRTRLAVAVAAACLALIQVPAVAQETGIEEIVVTARYRDESIQDVPLSMTAFSAKALEEARVDQVRDFIALTPNVTISQAQNVGLSALTIRGVSQVRNSEPPVATVVDGVLQVHPYQFTQELFDIERIEVLRGPQGALYGRNATGGAILITTRQPANEFEGHIRAGFGRGDERLVEGSVSGAIIPDRLLFRIGARYYDRDGYFDNITLDRKADPYEDVTMRSLLRLHVTDELTADLRVNVSRADGGALNYRFQPANLAADGVSLDLANPFDFTRVDADLVQRDILANNMGENDRDIDEISLKLDYGTDRFTLTSITSWNRIEEYAAGDQFPYTALALPASVFFLDGTQTQYQDVEAWSQELRLASSADQRLRWMIGAYYLETDRFISTTTGDDLGLGMERIERLPAFNSTINPTATFFADDNDNEAWAVFGNVAYDITDALEGSFALRYDKDRRRQHVSPLQVGGGVPGAVNRATFDKLQPKVSLRYQFTDDLTAYASWGEGFRSGQFNQNGVGAAAAAAGLPGIQDVIDEETTETWEMGMKSEWFDRRLRLNGAFFHTTLEDMPYFVFVGAVGAQVLVNIDKVRLVGGEVEAVANLAEGLDMYAGLGITDSEIRRYGLNSAAVGNDAPYVAEITFNAGAQYRVPLTSLFSGVVRLDYEHRGSQYWDPENSSDRSALDLLNLRFGIEEADGRWSVMGTVKNLTDEEYNSEWVLGGFGHAGLPRTWHVEFRYNF